MEDRNYQDELYHFGTKGMKWGIRRYQNSDGSLTSEGRKRYSVGQAIKDYRTASKRKKNLEKARVARIEKKKAEEQRKKDLDAGKIPAKKMTDDELKARIDRLKMEKDYNDLLKDRRSMERGSKFINKFLDSTIDKVADNSLADVVAQSLKVATVKGVNKIAGEEVVYTNNKRKN